MDIDHGPSALDVFEHVIFDMPREEFKGSVCLDTTDGGIDYHHPLTIVTSGEHTPRCFIGNAIVKAPTELGVLWRPYTSVGTYNESDVQFVSRVYNVPHFLVEHIYGGVYGLEFDDAVEFAQTCIDRVRYGLANSVADLPSASQFDGASRYDGYDDDYDDDYYDDYDDGDYGCDCEICRAGW